MDDCRTILSVEGLTTSIELTTGSFNAIEAVSFKIERGKVLGIVGESGSGKSTVAYSIMNLLDHPARITDGRVSFKGTELTKLSDAEMSRLRGNRITMIFQDPMMTLNPVLPIGTQIIEAITQHQNISRSAAIKIAKDTLGRVGIAASEERLDAYPHEFSGGMRQRVAIAIALVNNPDLIIADEPTTALDVTIQSQILSEMQLICEERNTALLWISHDLSVISGLVDEVVVMYAGRIMEYGPSEALLARPCHPYSRGLLDSVPTIDTPRGKLRGIPGVVPRPGSSSGCVFKQRCNNAGPNCDVSPALRHHDDRSIACHYPNFLGNSAC